MLVLLLAAAASQTPVEAERAFAADAQALGQWTAFRKWAAPDALMFLPQPANAHAAMRDWRDPPRAIAWWPTASYVSCDGELAVNTGGWRRPDGTVGYFSTVWRRQPDGGWRWIVDGGDTLAAARPQPAEPMVQRAVCRKLRPGVEGTRTVAGQVRGGGHSPDWTLTWGWQVRADGARWFQTSILTDMQYRYVIDDRIAAPPPPRPATPATP